MKEFRILFILPVLIAFAVGSANAKEQSVTNNVSSQARIVTLGNIAAEPMAAAELAQIQGNGHAPINLITHVADSFAASIPHNGGGMNWSLTAVQNLLRKKRSENAG